MPKPPAPATAMLGVLAQQPQPRAPGNLPDAPTTPFETAAYEFMDALRKGERKAAAAALSACIHSVLLEKKTKREADAATDAGT